MLSSSNQSTIPVPCLEQSWLITVETLHDTVCSNALDFHRFFGKAKTKTFVNYSKFCTLSGDVISIKHREGGRRI